MHPNDGRVVSSFIAQALTNRPTTIFGGTQTRSFCYDDLVGGLMALMETADDVAGPINLGNPEEYRIRALAETIIEMSNSRSGLVFKPLPSDDPTQRQPDIALARAALGWEPTIGLRDGITRTIAYFDGLCARAARSDASARPKTRGKLRGKVTWLFDLIAKRSTIAPLGR